MLGHTGPDVFRGNLTPTAAELLQAWPPRLGAAALGLGGPCSRRPASYRVFGHSPGLRPPNARSTAPAVTTQNVPGTATCPLGGKTTIA